MSEEKKQQTPKPEAPETEVSEEEETAPIPFRLAPVKKKPSRKYRKGSKYDPVLDEFIKQPNKLVKVDIPGKDANYIRTQLKKRIDARELKSITIAVVNDVCYLEKK